MPSSAIRLQQLASFISFTTLSYHPQCQHAAVKREL